MKCLCYQRAGHTYSLSLYRVKLRVAILFSKNILIELIVKCYISCLSEFWVWFLTHEINGLITNVKFYNLVTKISTVTIQCG